MRRLGCPSISCIKSRLAKMAGAEPAGQMKGEKLYAIYVPVYRCRALFFSLGPNLEPCMHGMPCNPWLLCCLVLRALCQGVVLLGCLWNYCFETLKEEGDGGMDLQCQVRCHDLDGKVLRRAFFMALQNSILYLPCRCPERLEWLKLMAQVLLHSGGSR